MKTKEAKIKKVFCCADCEKEFEEELPCLNDKGDGICQSCYDDNYFYCEHCDSVTHTDNKVYSEDGNICEHCYINDYVTCNECSDVINSENSYNHNDKYYCSNCYDNINLDEDDDEESSSNFTRSYHKGDKWTESTKRFYSTEIECYYPDTKVMRVVFDTMNKNFGVAHDGSLNSNGIEFQTPKLSGELGKTELKNFCKLLDTNKFKVDKTCGLHIHLDACDFMDIERNFIESYNNDYGETEEYNKKLDKIKNLMIFYLNFESVLLSYLPRSRRKNKYCYPLIENYHEKEIKNIKFIEDLEKMWYREGEMPTIDSRKSNRYDESRYSGINFHSMLANNHIEIRYHSGTINSTKILNWCALHVYILNKVYDGSITYSQLQDIKYITELSEKQEAMFKLLDLPESLVKYYKERQALFLGTSDDVEK